MLKKITRSQQGRDKKSCVWNQMESDDVSAPETPAGDEYLNWMVFPQVATFSSPSRLIVSRESSCL